MSLVRSNLLQHGTYQWRHQTTQEAQLSQRDRASRHVILPTGGVYSVSILHHFFGDDTFTVYVTACRGAGINLLEKSFIFGVLIKDHRYFSIHVYSLMNRR